MAAKKNFVINNSEMTIVADLEKLTAEEMKTVRTYVEFGYTFLHKEAKKRSGAKRNRSYYENNLIEVDRKIFADQADKKGRGEYAKAVKFASTVIKLGKLFDEGSIGDDVIEEYRVAFVEDAKKAELFAEPFLNAA